MFTYWYWYLHESEFFWRIYASIKMLAILVFDKFSTGNIIESRWSKIEMRIKCDILHVAKIQIYSSRLLFWAKGSDLLLFNSVWVGVMTTVILSSESNTRVHVFLGEKKTDRGNYLHAMPRNKSLLTTYLDISWGTASISMLKNSHGRWPTQSIFNIVDLSHVWRSDSQLGVNTHFIGLTTDIFSIIIIIT